jgi:hypothetical protein
MSSNQMVVANYVYASAMVFYNEFVVSIYIYIYRLGGNLNCFISINV